jgi:hypothetical protein
MRPSHDRSCGSLWRDGLARPIYHLPNRARSRESETTSSGPRDCDCSVHQLTRNGAPRPVTRSAYCQLQIRVLCQAFCGCFISGQCTQLHGDSAIQTVYSVPLSRPFLSISISLSLPASSRPASQHPSLSPNLHPLHPLKDFPDPRSRPKPTRWRYNHNESWRSRPRRRELPGHVSNPMPSSSPLSSRAAYSHLLLGLPPIGFPGTCFLACA